MEGREHYDFALEYMDMDLKHPVWVDLITAKQNKTNYIPS